MNRLAVLQRHLQHRELAEQDEAVLLTAPCSAPALDAAPAGGVVVVGGMVLDVQASPTSGADVRYGGSVPGRVRQAPGGVARNVAESLATLCKSAGAPPPFLISAVGDDLSGQALLAHWQSMGLSTAGIRRLSGCSTPSVAIVFDASGEVAASVADVGLLEEALGPAALRTHAATLAAAPVVMLDGNLSPGALQEACALAAAAGVPVWFEPVSQPKSIRAIAMLHQLAFVSPNEAELVAMAEAVRSQQQGRGDGSMGGGAGGSAAGRSSGRASGSCCRAGPLAPFGQPEATGGSNISSGAPLPADVTAALEPLLQHAATLLRAGVKHVVLTMGPLGAVLCTLCQDRSSSTRPDGGGLRLLLQHLPALPARVANCSGAGDCLVAGCLFGLARGLPPLQALACGVAASRSAVESEHNVPPGLVAAEMETAAGEVLARAAYAVVLA